MIKKESLIVYSIIDYYGWLFTEILLYKAFVGYTIYSTLAIFTHVL